MEETTLQHLQSSRSSRVAKAKGRRRATTLFAGLGLLCGLLGTALPGPAPALPWGPKADTARANPSAVSRGAGTPSTNVRKVFDLTTPGAAVAVAWASDGSAIAAASDYGGVLTVWDSNGHRIQQITVTGGGPALGGRSRSLQALHSSFFRLRTPSRTAQHSQCGMSHPERLFVL